jgi:hypothetical protein
MDVRMRSPTPISIRRVVVLCAVVGLTASCAWLPLGRHRDASAVPAASAADQQAMESEAGEPQGAEPGPSNPQAIPDPLHPIEHRIGETVEVVGATISYLGMEVAGDQLRARFRIESGSVAAETRLLTSAGVIVALHASGSQLVSDSFGSSAEPPARTSTITLVVGELLILFEGGPVS